MPAEPGPTPNRRQSATAGVRASDSEMWDDQVSLPTPTPHRTMLPVMHSLGDTKTENVLAIPSVWNSHSPAQITIHFCHQISPSQKDHLWLPYMKQHHFPVFPLHVTLFDINLFIYLLIICLSCHPHFRRNPVSMNNAWHITGLNKYLWNEEIQNPWWESWWFREEKRRGIICSLSAAPPKTLITINMETAVWKKDTDSFQRRAESNGRDMVLISE